MRRLSIFVICLMSSFISAFAGHASIPVKAGAKCLKIDQVIQVGTKKFTCIRSKSKLVWDLGVELLKPPIISAKSLEYNYEWEVTVENYLINPNSQVIFSYYFAVDGGMWNLYSKTTSTKEKIFINQKFKLVEIQVAVSDRSNQYVVSTKFDRMFPQLVVPPQSQVSTGTQTNSPTPLPSPEAPAVLRVDEPTLPTGFSAG